MTGGQYSEIGGGATEAARAVRARCAGVYTGYACRNPVIEEAWVAQTVGTRQSTKVQSVAGRAVGDQRGVATAVAAVVAGHAFRDRCIHIRVRWTNVVAERRGATIVGKQNGARTGPIVPITEFHDVYFTVSRACERRDIVVEVEGCVGHVRKAEHSNEKITVCLPYEG